MPSFEGLGSILLLVLVAAACWRLSRRRRSIGAGAVGSVYDLMNEDRRRAIEMVVEERAEARDPEDKDGNLPEIERPKR